MRKLKIIGIIFIGFFLFSGSMTFLFNFKEPEMVEANSMDFVKIKNGYLSYLDVEGYNFQFAFEINQILILESIVSIQEDQITIVSNNSFGRTELIFDRINNNEVKFSIDHQGNLQRDYWFRMVIFNNGLTHLSENNILLWNTGNFDYSDMVDESFWIDQNDEGDYWLSVRFLDQVDFYIDPILSSEIILDSTSVFAFENVSALDPDKLSVHYNFNYGSGTTAFDQSGNGIDATLTSTTWTSSVNEDFNWSIDLNADTDGFNMGDPDELEFSDASGDIPFMMEMWMYRKSSLNGFLFVKASGGSYPFYWQTSGQLISTFWMRARFDNSSGGGSGNYIYAKTVDIPQQRDTWCHIALSYDGSGLASGIKFWRNGTLIENTDEIDGGNYVQLQTGLSYNNYYGQVGSDGLKSKVDEYRVWKDVIVDNDTMAYQFEQAENYFEERSSVETGNWTGYVTNGTSQALYNLNYTISDPSNATAGESWVGHNHSFYYYHNYTFMNTTFGNGTIKTIESGFSINVENSTHDRVDFIAGTVEGNYIWWFLTENAIINLIINPDESNGTLSNVSSVDYNVEVANGSSVLPNSPVTVQILDSTGISLFSDSGSTNANGWLNSSTGTSQFSHSDNNTYWVRAISTNQSFVGVLVKRFYAFNDWDTPIINNIIFEDTLVTGISFACDIYVEDDYTELADLSITMYYSFVSSGTLTESSSLTLELDHYTVSLIGQDDGTTLWFKVTVADNLTNTFDSNVYQTDWVAAEEAAPSGGGDGNGNGAPPTAGQPAGGIPDVVLILLFGAGAVSVAVVGYAVLQRVQVRTRRVETREVVTGLGTFGRTQEKVVVKGRKPKKKKKRGKKK